MAEQIPVFKNNPVMVLVLGFVTCGLYLIYWNMKAAEVMNAVAEKEVIAQPIAIIGGFCFVVSAYFYYSAGKEALPSLYKKVGEADKDQSILLLVLGLLLSPVAAMIVQGDINKLYE